MRLRCIKTTDRPFGVPFYEGQIYELYFKDKKTKNIYYKEGYYVIKGPDNKACLCEIENFIEYKECKYYLYSDTNIT